jgi:hypothetical protein
MAATELLTTTTTGDTRMNALIRLQAACPARCRAIPVVGALA